MNDFREKHKEEWEKPVTMGILLEYTDSFLLPKMDEMLKVNSATLENNLKDYIDRKFSDHQTVLFKKMDEERKRDVQFKEKVIEIFRRQKIGSAEDIAYLEGLAFHT